MERQEAYRIGFRYVTGRHSAYRCSWKVTQSVSPNCNSQILIDDSDTTSSTLTSIFYELAKLPFEFSRLRDEIGSVVKAGETASNHKLQHLDLLNGIISETLRLHPPAGSLQRKTPPEGLTIGETYIPGDTNVLCPHYVVGRSKYWCQICTISWSSWPLDFVRWDDLYRCCGIPTWTMV